MKTHTPHTTARALLTQWDATHVAPPGWVAPELETLPPPLTALVAQRDALIEALGARPDAETRGSILKELRQVLKRIDARYGR